MNWERLMFEPAWRDDLVWMGWTDESRSRNRLLDLSLGRVREEEPGEWRAIQDTWLVGRGEGYTYFDGEDTFDGSCTLRRSADRSVRSPTAAPSSTAP